MTLRRLVSDELERFGVKPNEKILVGLSGGSDSVCLLHSLYSLKSVSVYALHVNHGIRGQQADDDEQFCIDLCQKLGIPLQCERIDIPALSANEKTGLEECARKYRYNALIRYAEQNGIKYIATAHNANDNVEAVLFNLCRGAGLKGLCGIPHIRQQNGVYIIRPIIKAEKKDILGYLEENALDYVNDSTNSCTDYTRNYIRHEILPHLSRVNPNYISNIANCGDILLSADDYIRSQAEEFLLKQKGTGICRSELLSLHKALAFQILTCWLSENSSYKMVNIVYDFAKNAENGSSIDVSSDTVIYAEADRITLVKRTQGGQYRYTLHEGVNKFHNLGFTLYLFYNKIPDGENIYKSLKCTIIDGDKINGSLFIRSRRDNDRFFYGGMTRMPKKILSAKQIPQHQRANYPVLCDENGSICMPSFPANDGYDGRNSKNKIIIAYRGDEA